MGNIVLGSDGISIRQGIYEQKENKMTDLGRFIDFQDGRRFRYCQADGNITRGHMCSTSEVDSDDNTVTQTSVTVALSNGYIGKTEVGVLLGSATTSNLYEDGVLTIEGGTGLGHIYRIKKNSAAGSVYTDLCKLVLYDPIVVALAADNVITLTKNKYKDVIVTPVSETGAAVGVPLIDITDNYYFWAQTRGYCCIIVGSSGALTVGQQVAIDDSVPGGLDPVGGYTEKPFGVCIQIAAVNTYATIDLKLE